ncbi:MAG TPA: hypothetical protein VG942_04875 [Hyphomonadaceae bacterium]|nr:hypothetical protein [Hyphomonadaceae bacterium]
MADRSPQDRLRRKSERGFQGYPLATVAFYGPDNRLASKVAVGIVRRDGGDVDVMEKWLSEASDVRDDATVTTQILEFVHRHDAKSVVIGPGILGCPHEEGIDYPLGQACPKCPYWAGRPRPI